MPVTPYRPAWWLPGPHLQTIWGRLARPKNRLPYRREVLVTPDNDDLILDHLDGPGDLHVVLLHGLEGSSHSVYCQGMAGLLAARGCSVTVMNFRGCARDPRDLRRTLPNRGVRLYHSGETTDLDFLLRTLAARHPERRFAAIGVSIGGNVLLKWLGEAADRRAAGRGVASASVAAGGGSEPPRLVAAATLSVPYDLAAGALALETGLGPHYTAMFLASMREKVDALLTRHPGQAKRVDAARVRRARTFFEFDDAATAPLHGFAGVDDYYARSSSLAFLDRVDTPTFCLSAADDPFLPRTALEAAAAVAGSNNAIRFIITPDGGHGGFVAGPWPGCSVYWGEATVVEELLDACGEQYSPWHHRKRM